MSDLPPTGRVMSQAANKLPLTRRAWFIATWVICSGLMVFAGFIFVAFKNAGAMMAMMPIQMPIDGEAEYEKRMLKLKAAASELDRFYALGDAALWSVDVGKLDDAERYANELLVLNTKTGRDWNIGNAIHKAHSTLGRVAIKRGDVTEGERQLGLAASSKGSPQMDTFGPNMSLPRDLLATRKASAKAAVLAYFDYLPTFWTMDNGAIRVWRSDVENDRTPNFGAHLLF